ncbi:indole-3-glycerol-phosphate synthase [Polycladomyces abyssicola]|uniref:Indole-3-glycerol phosphate synthase n=1 Tax=Polycladomyces abyssicola TaxID=1125966 RepID=A0A8D5ZNW5_9BACL|nr:indole-3-glycerol phosphate synthase TrpC [Polycladomyces abyssicola]BCU81796.1 indole-3-glycerol-phosphate synthase [Polycladomyces abyssicola]
MFLDKIVSVKREEVQRLKNRLTSEDAKRAERMLPVRSLAKAMKRTGGVPALIAEVKPASPSKGTIRETVDPVQIAAGYERGGAAAISVLTDETFFRGRADYLTAVKQTVNIPVLRKDFLLDESQVVESRLIGADAILLIAAILDEERLVSLSRRAHELGLEVLIEVHREEELDRALAARPDVLGVNNRDLQTFVTDLATTERLRPLLPDSIPVITESGIASPEDVARAAAYGVDGMLVGESLMRQDDPESAVRALLTGAISCEHR